MKPFLNFIRAMERDMGWVQIRRADGTVEHFGDLTDSAIAFMKNKPQPQSSVRNETSSDSWRTDGYDPEQWGE